MVWKPPKKSGLAIALLALSVLAAIALLVAYSLIGQEIGLGFFLKILWLICNVALLAVGIRWTVELGRLRYHMDRDALTIHCGTHRCIVPLGNIEGIVPATEFQAIDAFEGLHWPGYWRGQLYLEGVGKVRVYATKPLQQLLIAVTDGGGYAISPQDAEEFLSDYAVRRDMGPLHSTTEDVEYGPTAQWPVWQDTRFWGIFAVGFLTCLMLSGYLMWRYQGLPKRLILRLPSQGTIGRVALKENLLVIPALGVTVLAVNVCLGILLHRRERLAAYLLILAALGIQLLFVLALVIIL
ncbi:MAG: PH domain-containing protein [Anaerolineales bacterium]